MNQKQDLAEKKEWMNAFAACFTELEKTLYGRGAQRGGGGGGRAAGREGRISGIPLWMVREGNMVSVLICRSLVVFCILADLSSFYDHTRKTHTQMRETYLMPDTEENAFGFMNFNQLRLIVDPQAQEKGGMGQQVMNLLRRGSLAQFNIKVGPDFPVPCEQVSNIVSSDM